MQSTVRGYLVRKQHRPRYKGIVKIRALEASLKQLETTSSQLKKDKAGAQSQIQKLKMSITGAIKRIKVQSRQSF